MVAVKAAEQIKVVVAVRPPGRPAKAAERDKLKGSTGSNPVPAIASYGLIEGYPNDAGQ